MSYTKRPVAPQILEVVKDGPLHRAEITRRIGHHRHDTVSSAITLMLGQGLLMRYGERVGLPNNDAMPWVLLEKRLSEWSVTI